MRLSFKMAKILSGEKLAKSILLKLKKKKDRKPTLAVVQVGKNAVSAKYIEEKRKAAKRIGVRFRLVEFPQNVSQKTLERELGKLAASKTVSGILVQLPLPSRLNAARILDLVPKEKDVDVLSSAAFADFALGKSKVLPPTVAAISLFLQQTRKRLEGAKVTIVGAGRLVGLPIALWLVHQGAQVSLVQKGTRNMKGIVKKADIVISGVGKPGLIQGTMIKKGAVVIDAGTSVEGGATKGDVDFESVSKRASYLTPVPGGVGPLTVAWLFSNLFGLHD